MRQLPAACGSTASTLPGARRLWLLLLVCLSAAAALPAADTPTDMQLHWEALPDLPNPIGLGGPIVGTSNSALVVAGGANFPNDPPWPVDGRPPGKKVWHAEIYALQPVATEWIAAGQLPYPLAYAACVSVQEGVYVLGGETFGPPGEAADGASINHPLAEVFLLTWYPLDRAVYVERHALPDLPRPCQYHAAVLLANQIYVAASDAATAASRRLDRKAFWRLDLNRSPKDRRWEELPAWPGAPREKMALIAQRAPAAGDSSNLYHGMCLFLIGGSTWAKHADGSPDDARATHFDDGYRYDPQENRWTPIARLPSIPETRRLDLAGFRWDSSAQSWLPDAAAPSPSPAELDALFQQQGRPLGASPAIAWGDHEILLMSGATGRYVTLPVERRPPFPREVLAYDTRSDSWRVAGEMPVGVVTTSATRWTNFFAIPSGETRPGVRTPRVQAIRVK